MVRADQGTFFLTFSTSLFSPVACWRAENPAASALTKLLDPFDTPLLTKAPSCPKQQKINDIRNNTRGIGSGPVSPALASFPSPRTPFPISSNLASDKKELEVWEWSGWRRHIS